MSDHGHSHPHQHDQHTPDKEVNDDDQRVDAKAALVIFVCLVAMAVHFVSGWTFS